MESYISLNNEKTDEQLFRTVRLFAHSKKLTRFLWNPKTQNRVTKERSYKLQTFTGKERTSATDCQQF